MLPLKETRVPKNRILEAVHVTIHVPTRRHQLRIRKLVLARFHSIPSLNYPAWPDQHPLYFGIAVQHSRKSATGKVWAHCFATDPPVSARDIIRHRLNRHVRGEWAGGFPLNSSEGHIPNRLALRSFIDRFERLPDPACPGGSMDSSTIRSQASSVLPPSRRVRGWSLAKQS